MAHGGSELFGVVAGDLVTAERPQLRSDSAATIARERTPGGERATRRATAVVGRQLDPARTVFEQRNRVWVWWWSRDAVIDLGDDVAPVHHERAVGDVANGVEVVG